MKKFSFLALAAIIGVSVLNGTASAQYRVFGGRCGSCQATGSCQPNVTYQPSVTYYQPSVTYHQPFNPCGNGVVVNGFVVQPQQVIGQPKVIVAPNPNELPPYKGEEPKKITPAIEPTLPQKKIPAPNPLQSGPDGAISIIYINGMAYGRISDGSYANIANGDYQRLTLQYGNK